jgi:hypothetical protein
MPEEPDVRREDLEIFEIIERKRIEDAERMRRECEAAFKQEKTESPDGAANEAG